MFAPLRRHDVIAGIAVCLWLVGMGLVLGLEDASWQLAGGALWAVGFVVAAGVAARAYRARDPYAD